MDSKNVSSGNPIKGKKHHIAVYEGSKKGRILWKIAENGKNMCGGGVHFLEIYVQDGWLNNKCIDSSVCIW